MASGSTGLGIQPAWCASSTGDDRSAGHSRRAVGSISPLGKLTGLLVFQCAITGSPSDGASAELGSRNAVSTAPTTKIPAPHARVAV